MLHKKNYIHNGPNYETHEEDQIVYVGFRVSNNLGID
jgi:hypothetical protein